MSETKLTAEEVLESLTGFDEMAILQHFGRNVSALTEDQSTLARALVFVLKRRDGDSDDTARNLALEMTLKDVTDYFAEESEADEESGKDEPLNAPQLVISQPSAS